jgi:hypothetical protein
LGPLLHVFVVYLWPVVQQHPICSVVVSAYG